MTLITKIYRIGALSSLLLLAISTSASCAERSGATVISDIQFAEFPERKLRLNLHLPNNIQNPPLIVNIHGGGWKVGNRKSDPTAMVEKGYAVANIEYRYSTEAIFPAQIFDCKGAIRWLRAHQKDYGYNAKSIAVVGNSAGGHLAVLLGTSSHEKELEGDTGGNLNQSSVVQAIVDYYGASDFVLRAKNQPDETEKKGGVVYDLLGGPVLANIEKAKLASGAFHVTSDDPPLLIFHGTEDKTVLMDQSERLIQAYKSNGLSVTFQKVEGAGHGGALFKSPANTDLLFRFLDEHLRKHR